MDEISPTEPSNIMLYADVLGDESDPFYSFFTEETQEFIPETPIKKTPGVQAICLTTNTAYKSPKQIRRRIVNNISARKSRLKRKEKEQLLAEKVNELQRENDILKAKLACMKDEVVRLRKTLNLSP